jgi:hypothetical protein
MRGRRWPRPPRPTCSSYGRLHAPLQDSTVRRPAAALLATALGTTLAVWWEFYERIVYHDVGPPQVGYDDTVLDLLMGTLSSVAAGLALVAWAGAGGGALRAPAGGRWPVADA